MQGYQTEYSPRKSVNSTYVLLLMNFMLFLISKTIHAYTPQYYKILQISHPSESCKNITF